MKRPSLRHVAWLALSVSCAVYLLVSVAHHEAFHPWGRLGFFDLKVYRGAARLVLDGRPVYGGPIWHWAPFTYPPFAALVFTPLALLPTALDEVLVTLVGFIALSSILSLALRLPTGNGSTPQGGACPRAVLIPLALAAALWLEPITATLGYGQIDLLITLLVVSDLTRRDAARGKGALIGVAAGLKLTPLIFVPYLLFSRRGRAASVAIRAFVATVAAGSAVLPDDSWRFWAGGLFLDARRVGGRYVPANQSLRGLILRLDPSCASGWMIAIALLVAIAGLALAILASRRGDEAAGFSLCALTGLLVSPVSWTHHWTLAVPVLLLLGVRVARSHSRTGRAAFTAILLGGYAYLPKLMTKPAFAPIHGPSVVWTLAAAPYVAIGGAALALAGAHEIRRIAASPASKRAMCRRGVVTSALTPDLRGTR
jgi:alpha-1,2-mannosyltransferase